MTPFAMTSLGGVCSVAGCNDMFCLWGWKAGSV